MWVGESCAERARSPFFQHREKGFSFTDCAGFVVMRELTIRQALTSGAHFRQMGL
jgi:predicted nucleic acid-binding protein